MTASALSEYLKALIPKLKLKDGENTQISSSLAVITAKLKVFFAEDNLKEIFVFGSFERETLLTRKVDEESDIDILIVFDEKKWEPQTYLNKLKQFANENYQRSEIYQDHPTIVIELTRIKFELVPCVYISAGLFTDAKYLIPKKEKQEVQWIKTEPYLIKNKIAKFPKTKETLMDLIYLYKYWNIVNNRIYSTYSVESFIIINFNYEKDLLNNFFRMIDNLRYNNPTDAQNEASKKAKISRNKIQILLENDMEDYAVLELQKIVPDL